MPKRNRKKAEFGYVYVVTNGCFRKVYSPIAQKALPPVKIGRSKDCISRVGSLSSGVFDDFIYHMVIPSTDYKRCEDDIHDRFPNERIPTGTGGKTEFFKCPIEEVLKRIEKYISKSDNVIKDDVQRYGVVGKVFGRSASAQKKEIEKQSAMRQSKKKGLAGGLTGERKAKRVNFSFDMIGLKNGDRLVFIPTGAKVIAVTPNKVRQGNDVFTLTGYAKKYMPNNMRNSKDSYQGPAYFAYKGKKLTKMREEIGA